MPYDCFLSYASPDLRHAEEVHRRLTAAGFTVWFDKARLRPGFDWHREIEAGCEESRILLPLLTPRWKRSEWTRYETYGAEAVIPILAEGAWEDVSTPPLARFQNHAIPLAGAGDADWERLFAAIRERLAGEAPQKSERVAHLRYRPNPYFVGREETLNEIHEKLFINPTAALTQGHIEAITALGGVGKTTLARQYAEKFWRCYRQMFWVDCRKSLESEFAAIHDILRPEPAYQTLKDAEKAAWVRVELNQAAQRPLRLLILDNAEDEDSVLPWIPKTGNCHTVITSRFTGWSAGIETCPVWVLPPEPARELLLRRAGRSVAQEGAVCDAVAKKLGYLPLALEQAAAYVREQGPGYPFADYLRLFEENERKFLARKAPGTTEYPDSVFLTWRATIDKLPAGARAMLRLCAFLASTPVPAAMFVKGAGIVAEEAQRVAGGEKVEAGEFEILEWKAALARYSMINLQAGDSFSVHGLVQAVERHQVDARERPRLIERSVDLFAGWAPVNAGEYENWPVWKVLLPHAESLWRWQRDDDRVQRNAGFLHSLGMFRAYAAAELPVRRALEARERVLGAEDPDTLGSVNNLVFLLASQGDYGAAEALYRQAIETARRVLGASSHTAVLEELSSRLGKAFVALRSISQPDQFLQKHPRLKRKGPIMSLDRTWHSQQCQKYKVEFPAYKTYASVLDVILKAACRLHAPLGIVQSRAKTFASFAEKVARKADKYKALGLEPTDLCGARVITETEAEVERICKAIREVFTIDEANSLDVRTRLHTAEFGYLSVHYVVQLPGAEILGVRIPPEIGGLKAEIQVRTLLQHAWASISHDRIYKSSFRVPPHLGRELARVAAFLEEADQQFGGVVEALDDYKPHYGVYMSAEQLAQEVDVLETVLANEPDRAKQPAGALRLARVWRATAEWPRIVEVLRPYLKKSQPCQAALLAEHGHALCRLHQAAPRETLFCQGYRELSRAASMPSGAARTRILAYRAWASARLPDNEVEARDCYRAAYEADRRNPFHLASYVEYEIYCGDPLGFRAMMRPVFEQAIRTCRAHVEAGIELPWAFFTMGRFHLLMDETYQSLGAYAKAIRLCLSGASPVPDAALTDEIAFIHHIHRAKRPIPEEHNWVLQLLLLAQRVRSGATLEGLAAKRTEFARPVAILAGGTAASCQPTIERFRGSVLKALKGFRGTVISGGTRAGVAGLAGEVAAQATVGYIPRNLPYDQPKDDRYTAHVPSDGPGYGAVHALQYWTDVLLAGVRPEDVRLLGIDGGRISAFEYRLALALGAQVAILEPATRATAELQGDPDWSADPNLLRLPNDPMTLRVFFTPPSPALTAQEIDALAGRIHANFLAENRYKNPDPAMKPWDKLDDGMKLSNRLQAERAAGFLEKIGYRVERARGRITPAELTAKQVEALAEMEHGRWVVERLRSGWRYDPKRDPANKLSPYLVGWAALTQKVKGYDRNAVKAWPALLAEAGFALRR